MPNKPVSTAMQVVLNVNVFNFTTSATTATYLSSKSVGASTQLVYINSNRSPAAGTIYAGGTKVQLNGGSSSGGNNISIYAPTASGSSNSLLISNGVGKAPSWSTASGISAGSATKATQDSSGQQISSTFVW